MKLASINASGFSLVEVLIAAAITSIVGLVVASMITNMQLSVSNAEFRLAS